MTEAGDPVEGFALALEQPGMVSVAEPRRRLDQCIEHCLQIECRPADDFKHLGGSSLLLTSLVQLAREERDFFLFRIRSTVRAARRRPPSSGRSRGRAFFTTLRHVRPSSADSLTCDPRAAAAASRPAARIRPAWYRTRRTPPQAPFRGSPRAHARRAR